MRLLHFLNDSLILLLLGLIHSIFKIHTLYRLVGRNLDNVHAVYITELFFLSKRRTRHTALLVKFIEQVLECDRRQRLALPAHFHMFLRLDRLMKPVGITAARHDTSGELIDDHNFTF